MQVKETVVENSGMLQGPLLKKHVILKENGQRTKVKLGKIYGNWVEVISGLEAGDKIKIAKFKFDQQKTRKSPLLIKKD